MKKQITRVSVLQTSKVVTILYALMSLLYSVIGLFMVLFGSGEIRVMGFIYLFMPVLMAVLGFIMMLLCCWLYNVVAKWVGGVEFTVADA